MVRKTGTTKIPNDVKKALIEHVERTKSIQNKDLVIYVKNKFSLDIDPSTVSKTLANKEKYKAGPSGNYCQIRSPKHEKLEEQLYNWISEINNKPFTNMKVIKENLNCPKDFKFKTIQQKNNKVKLVTTGDILIRLP